MPGPLKTTDDIVAQGPPATDLAALGLAPETPAKTLSAAVTKPVPVSVDVGNMVAFDDNVIYPEQYVADGFIKQLARDATQALVNAIFSLPRRTASQAAGQFGEGAPCVFLPAGTTRLPRAMPLPSQKLMTRWEKFAQAKGIKKQKKDRTEYDPVSRKWVPRTGYKGNVIPKDQIASDWIVEVPDGALPGKDGRDAGDALRAAPKAAKKANVEKNKMQQRRNVEESMAMRAGSNPRLIRQQQVAARLNRVKSSTASLGVFDEQLAGEDKVKPKGKKREFASNSDLSGDRDRLRSMAHKVATGEGMPHTTGWKAQQKKRELNVTKAVKAVHQDSDRANTLRREIDQTERESSLRAKKRARR